MRERKEERKRERETGKGKRQWEIIDLDIE